MHEFVTNGFLEGVGGCDKPRGSAHDYGEEIAEQKQGTSRAKTVGSMAEWQKLMLYIAYSEATFKGSL